MPCASLVTQITYSYLVIHMLELNTIRDYKKRTPGETDYSAEEPYTTLYFGGG